jgi:hypothetical protein
MVNRLSCWQPTAAMRRKMNLFPGGAVVVRLSFGQNPIALRALGCVLSSGILSPTNLNL